MHLLDERLHACTCMTRGCMQSCTLGMCVGGLGLCYSYSPQAGQTVPASVHWPVCPTLGVCPTLEVRVGSGVEQHSKGSGGAWSSGV